MEKQRHDAAAFSRLFEVSVPHVLCRIFLDLDVADVANCRSVCKAWKRFIDAHILERNLGDAHETSLLGPSLLRRLSDLLSMKLYKVIAYDVL